MTRQQKQEAKLNRVLDAVKERLGKNSNKEWVKGWCDILNMTGFLYGVSRLNDLQVMTRLVFACIAVDMKQDDILKLLADKGELFYGE